MKIMLIRHGEPDYRYIRERGFIGHGIDLGNLTTTGKAQALAAAADNRLDGIELIVSSPYTRALQTAAIISRYRDVEIEIETDLHEWLPDMTFQYSTDEESTRAYYLCEANKGKRPADSPMKYEETESVFNRANRCLKKYLSYNKIAVVAHGMLIKQFADVDIIPHCGIVEIDYDDDFRWSGLRKS